jgi:hypothetical protein
MECSYSLKPLSGLLTRNRAKDALDLFEQMTTAPSEFTLAIVFKICTQLTDDRSFQLAKRILHSMPMIHRKNTIVLTSALKIFMHRGEISLGEKIFAQINKDMKSYGVMVSGKTDFLP